MQQPDIPLVQVQLETVSPEFAELIIESSPPPEFLVICVNLATEIAHTPENAKLVITGDFVQSTRARFGDTKAANSYNLSRGEGFVGGKTMRNGDTFDVLVHADMFAQALDYRANPDAAFTFLKTLVHEMNHVAMYQRGESTGEVESESWKSVNLLSSASAVIDEYRAELGALTRLPTDGSVWNPSDVILWLEKSLIGVVAEYQLHLDVERLALEVGSQALIALKQLAYCVAYEQSSGDRLSLELDDLRYAKARLRLPQWFDSFRKMLGLLPSGENALPRSDEHEAIRRLSQVVDEHLRIVGFDWDEPMFQIERGLLELL